MKVGQQAEAVAQKCSLENFTKFTGKHLCQSLFFNKVAGLRPAVAASEQGPTKTIKQCKTKLTTSKDAYKKAKDNNVKTGTAPIFFFVTKYM